MQVVVLAGGIGSRLRPWTNSTPKPLLPMLDKTLLEHVVDCVPASMVDEVVIAAGYKVNEMRAYFAQHPTDFDVRIIEETEPLGTGGALANCKDVISGQFACFNGDIVSSLNLDDLLEVHSRNQSIGTLGLWEVEDPTRFGIVGIDEHNLIHAFKEKPTREEVFSNLINAGSYLFEDDIFDWLPTGKHSIEREVFPRLADEGLLSGVPFDGYFIDAGTPSAWNEAMQACIQGAKFSTGLMHEGNWFADSKRLDGDIQHSMIGKGVIGERATIHSTSILEGARIGHGTRLTNCLVGQSSIIGADCDLDGVVIDHHSTIPNGTKQRGGAWPNTPEQD